VGSDTNQNTVIPWCESLVGAITRLKGLGASLDIKSSYDTAINRLVPLDAETLKTLPPPKVSSKYAPGQSVIMHSIPTDTMAGSRRLRGTVRLVAMELPLNHLLPATLGGQTRIINVLIDTGFAGQHH